MAKGLPKSRAPFRAPGEGGEVNAPSTSSPVRAQARTSLQMIAALLLPQRPGLLPSRPLAFGK